MFLEILQNSWENTCARVSILTQLQGWGLTKIQTLSQVFSCEFCEISKNTSFTEHLRATASVFQIKSFRKIIFGSVSDDASVELENSVHWQCAMCSWISYIIFPFISSIALFSSRKMWLSYLSHAVSSHGKLIDWTSGFYLSFCCMVFPRILNIITFMSRVVSIICIC